MKYLNPYYVCTKFRRNLRWVAISHVDLTWNDPLVTHTNHQSIIILYEPIKRVNKQELNGVGTKPISPLLSIKLLLIIARSRVGRHS